MPLPARLPGLPHIWHLPPHPRTATRYSRQRTTLPVLALPIVNNTFRTRLAAATMGLTGLFHTPYRARTIDACLRWTAGRSRCALPLLPTYRNTSGSTRGVPLRHRLTEPSNCARKHQAFYTRRCAAASALIFTPVDPFPATAHASRCNDFMAFPLLRATACRLYFAACNG